MFIFLVKATSFPEHYDRFGRLTSAVVVAKNAKDAIDLLDKEDDTNISDYPKFWHEHGEAKKLGVVSADVGIVEREIVHAVVN